MDDLQPNITIEEFDGKKFQIQFFNPENSAVVTHYLHNYRNGVKQFFEKDALDLINYYVDYKSENENSNIIMHIIYIER